MLRRRIPQRCDADRPHPVRRGRRPALRLDRSGHLRGAGRRHRERAARGGHRVPARRRAPRQGRRHRRPPRRPGGAGGRPAPCADTAAASPARWRPRPADWRPRWPGRSLRAVIRSWRIGSSRSDGHWYDHNLAGSGIRPSDAADGPSRHLGARSARRAVGPSTDTAPTTWRGYSSSPPGTTDPTEQLNGLAGVALRFLNDAQALAGACRNRMDSTGRWVDEPAVEDAWGRCVWGLGTAAAHSNVAWVRQSAIMQFERAAQERSEWPRAMAFAALGAAELLAVDPAHAAARALIADYAASVPAAERRPGVAVARIPADLRERRSPRGDDRGRGRARRRDVASARPGSTGLAASTSKRADGHLSPTPVAGRGAEDARPAFDQQPIEVSIARRCVRASGCRRPQSELARRSAGRSGLVHGRQRRGTADVGPRNGRRIRRFARRRCER